MGDELRKYSSPMKKVLEKKIILIQLHSLWDCNTSKLIINVLLMLPTKMKVDENQQTIISI